MAEQYPQRLAERYGIEDFSAPLKMLEDVCVRRGFMLRGGEFDYDRACKAVVDDLRKGRLGRICLDGAEDVRSARF